MSLETYRKNLELQRQREEELLNKKSVKKLTEKKETVSNKKPEPYEYIHSGGNNLSSQKITIIRKEIRHNSKSNFILSSLFLFIIILFALAFLKNPSEPESRQLLKTTALEYLKDKARNKIDESDSVLESLGTSLAMALSPLAYDYLVETKVKDNFFTPLF